MPHFLLDIYTDIVLSAVYFVLITKLTNKMCPSYSMGNITIVDFTLVLSFFLQVILTEEAVMLFIAPQ